MKIQVGDGKVYEVEEDILDVMALEYGNRMLEFYHNQDVTLQFALKIVTSRVLKEFMSTFGMSAKLPRGTDPTEFLLKAYTILMRQAVGMLKIRLLIDEEAGSVVDASTEYEGIEQLAESMRFYLEGLKHGTTTALPTALERAQLGAGTESDGPSERRDGPELVAGGQEAQWQDDGGEATGGIARIAL